MSEPKPDFIGDLVRLFYPNFGRRKRFRAMWGLAGEKDGWLVSRHFDLTRTDSAAHWVDDKTWADLEMPKIFANLDTTVTQLGSQYLYRQLRHYEYNAQTIAQRYETSRTLQNDRDLRERLQLILAAFDADSNAHIADVLFGPAVDMPKRPLLIVAASLLSLTTLFSAIALSTSVWYWFAALGANAVVIALSAPRKLRRDAEALVHCRRMLRIAERLSAVNSSELLPQITQLRQQRPRRAMLKKGTWPLALLSRDDSLLGGLVVLANTCFLAQFLAYMLTARSFRRLREDWISTFELIGSIDASIAVANLLHRNPHRCRPVVSGDALIALDSAYHPLVSQPVANSIRLECRSALVTGSNMAGKTTFMKTVATNIVLGHTLGICFAAAATIPRTSVMVYIRDDQSVESGSSHFFSEVRAIIGFIERAARGDCHFFAIDELFSGTNTVERIAIAKAVLDYLSARALVVVTSHDVELQGLLSAHFDLYHFQEDPAVEGFFDYKLHSGMSHKRNAIRVLERMGFPDEIVNAALAHVGRVTGAIS